MTTIKVYSDLQQSKKLAEILPIESADMFWQSNLNSSDRQYLLNMGEKEYFNIEMNLEHCSIGDYDIPCWSLSVLLAVLPDHFYDETGKNKFGMDKDDYSYYVFYETQNSYIQTSADNPVDACVDMIIKLHELKKL